MHAMVEQLMAWYEQNRASLEGRGLDVRLNRSPADGRPKSSAWVTIRRGDADAEIIVWDTGECELVRTPGASGPFEQEHRQLASEYDLRDVISWLLVVF